MPKEHRPSWVRFFFPPVLTSLLLSLTSHAAINVLPPQEITEQVVVRPYVVRKNASTVASFMGSESSEAYIKQQVNRIWAQVGVEVLWADEVEYLNAFAYDGSPGNYASSDRPRSHLSTILNAPGSPALDGDPLELNMFFVGISAGFSQLGANSVAGLASVDRNGSTLYVGANLLGWNGGRDVVASVIAHEIGHNLGLDHYQADISNLMFSGREGDGEELISLQDSIIGTNNYGFDGFDFLQAIEPETNYLAWAESFGLQEGLTGDDDKDRLSNAFEFLFGSSPVDATVLPSPTNTTNGLIWELGKTAGAVEDGFDFQAESSSDFNDWRLAGTSGSTSALLENSSARYRVRLDGGLDRNFIRFDVVLPPAASVSTAVLPIEEGHAGSTHPAHDHSACGPGGCGHRTLYRN